MKKKKKKKKKKKTLDHFLIISNKCFQKPCQSGCYITNLPMKPSYFIT